MTVLPAGKNLTLMRDRVIFLDIIETRIGADFSVLNLWLKIAQNF